MAAWWFPLYVIQMALLCQMFAQEACSEQGAVRLVEGDNSYEGRLEICVNGQWGTVCNDGLADVFDINAARVACRQLGIPESALSDVVTNIFFGGGGTSQPIHLDKLQCSGTETTLLNCTHNGIGVQDCGHPEDVGIICQRSQVCTDGDVRLVDGDNYNATQGRVEYCVGGRWGTVCSDVDMYQREDYLWGDTDAAVVCRQLGLKALDPRALTANVSQVKNLQTPIVLNGLNCQGVETRLDACGHLLPVEYCSHSNDAGAFCGVCRENDVRLFQYYEGQIENEGLVMLCQGGTWGVLCSNFNNNDAKVVCRQLGYNVEDGGELTTISNYAYGGNTLTIQFECLGSENSISQCPQSNGAGFCNLQATAVTCPVLLNDITTMTATDIATMIPVTTEDLIVGLATVFLIVLSFIAIVSICLVTVSIVVKKRKATVRNLQVQVLTSPSDDIQSLEHHNLGSTMKEIDIQADAEGSKWLRHASPNPYSTNQELALSVQQLRPVDNKTVNRISSSIIRELSSNMLIPYTRLKLMECVGQGEFGVVYKAKYTEPEGDIGYVTSTVAVKTLKGFFDKSQVNKIMEESIKMKHFDHPNVLHLIGVCLDAGPAPYVVMPYMANGSLVHYLKKERSSVILEAGVDEDVKIEVRKRLTVMCLQIASGMEYLAGERFVHRDLAARNCMIDIHFVIKIADFGLSEDIYAKNYFRQSESIKLPVKWMAPESLSDGVFSEKSDVWSFGVTCWEIFNGGKTPYPGMDPLLLSQMLDTEQRLNKPFNAACPDEMYSLMLNCWSHLPDNRPSFNEIVTTISNYTENIAGYLEINFNPFMSAQSESVQSTTNTTISPSLDLNNDTMRGSTEAVAKCQDSKRFNLRNSFRKLKGTKFFSKASPKPSPNASPCVSPQASPLLKLKKLDNDQLSTTSSAAGIEIRIESPSSGEEITIASSSL